MSFGMLVAVIGGIFKLITLGMGMESYSHDMILDSFFVKLGLFVTFGAVAGSFVVMLIAFCLSFMSHLFLNSFMQPSSVVLANGERLRNVDSDLITGNPTSGTDSQGNVWDYCGNDRWMKR